MRDFREMGYLDCRTEGAPRDMQRESGLEQQQKRRIELNDTY